MNIINFKMPNRYDAKTTYLGIVNTVNPNANYGENPIVRKVVVLKKIKVKDTFKFVPLLNYSGYYEIIETILAVSNLEQNEKGIFGYLSDDQLNKAILKTGYPEVEILKPNSEVNKQLQKVA